MGSRLLVVLAAVLGWSGVGPSRWGDGPAFDWWRRSVRRSITIAVVLVLVVIALPLLAR